MINGNNFFGMAVVLYLAICIAYNFVLTTCCEIKRFII